MPVYFSEIHAARAPNSESNAREGDTEREPAGDALPRTSNQYKVFWTSLYMVKLHAQQERKAREGDTKPKKARNALPRTSDVHMVMCM
jgi:hypothetical protein